MNPDPSAWSLDAPNATAKHSSGLVLDARRIPGTDRFEVRPRPSTLPFAAPGLSPEERQAMDALIGQRVLEGGQLLVALLATAH